MLILSYLCPALSSYQCNYYISRHFATIRHTEKGYLKLQERPFSAVRGCVFGNLRQPEVTQSLDLCGLRQHLLFSVMSVPSCVSWLWRMYVSVYWTWQGTSYRIDLKNKSPSSDYVNSLWSGPDFEMKALRCLSQFKWNTERRGTGSGTILDLWASRRLQLWSSLD